MFDTVEHGAQLCQPLSIHSSDTLHVLLQGQKDQDSRMAALGLGTIPRVTAVPFLSPVIDGTSQAGTIPLPDNSSWPHKLLRVGFDETTRRIKHIPLKPEKNNGGRDKQMTQICLAGIDGKG